MSRPTTTSAGDQGHRSRRPDDRRSLPRFARFVIVGGAAGLSDLGCYALLQGVAGAHPLAANLVSRPLGGLVSFALNRAWTFGTRGRSRVGTHFLRYWVLWVAMLALSETILGLLHDAAGVPPLPAKLLTEGVLGVVTFLVHRCWTFR